MRLLSLELTGFKSFAKKTVFTFNTDVTGVVGPNGSGKSNVAEGFRWVLGEQSMKSLRGKRGEDLIFNGGHTGGEAGRASATVVFDNRDKSLPYDYDEIAVTRTVYRDGVNTYSLNGSVVRLKDVLELLSGAGLGSSGHHIISQGEADKILNSSPRDRREMIEDALGLKVYQWKIEETEKKLLQTKDNIREVQLLRREIVPHLKFLEIQVTKIRETAEIRSRLKTLYLEYLFREEEYLKHKRQEINDRKQRPTEELVAVNNKIKELGEDLSAPDARLKDKEDKLRFLERSIFSVQQDKDKIARDLGRIEGTITAHQDFKKEETNISVPWSEIVLVRDEMSSLVQQYEYSTDFNQLKNLVAVLLENINKLVNRYKTQTENSDNNIKILSLKKEAEGLNKNLADLELKASHLNAEKIQAQLALDDEKKYLQSAERNRYELRAKKSEIEAILNDLSHREHSLMGEEEDFRREIEEGVTLVDIEIRDYRRLLKEVPSMNEPREVQVDRRREMEKIKLRLEDAGVGHEGVLEEFKETTERHDYLVKELADLEQSAESLKVVADELSAKIATEFKEGIQKINQEFSSYFALMFGGGTARLDLVSSPVYRRDTKEETEEVGVEIKVNLPRKKIKGLDMMSGGERALTSIALLFAMSQVNPPPFLILDETDAALDEANSKKYGDMIERLAKDSQLIVITHNRETMSRAGILYGVTMGRDGISKLLSIKFEEAEGWAK
ncbi:MAG: chromosome segregation protein [Patescibacteria group bacterium]|nr:chromosome segregation protein [Patescibacteria group bacterium]